VEAPPVDVMREMGDPDGRATHAHAHVRYPVPLHRVQFVPLCRVLQRLQAQVAGRRLQIRGGLQESEDEQQQSILQIPRLRACFVVDLPVACLASAAARLCIQVAQALDSSTLSLSLRSVDSGAGGAKNS